MLKVGILIMRLNCVSAKCDLKINVNHKKVQVGIDQEMAQSEIYIYI